MEKLFLEDTVNLKNLAEGFFVKNSIVLVERGSDVEGELCIFQ